MTRRYFLRGAGVTCAIVFCIAVVILVQAGFSYDGTCGGLQPALAGPRPCPFLEYVFGNMLLFGLVLGVTYWPFVLALLLLPPLAGYLLDRRR